MTAVLPPDVSAALCEFLAERRMGKITLDVKNGRVLLVTKTETVRVAEKPPS